MAGRHRGERAYDEDKRKRPDKINLIRALVYKSLADWLSGLSDDKDLIFVMFSKTSLADWIFGYLYIGNGLSDRLTDWICGKSDHTYQILANQIRYLIFSMPVYIDWQIKILDYQIIDT